MTCTNKTWQTKKICDALKYTQCCFAYTQRTFYTQTPATKDEACAAAKRNKKTAHTDGKYSAEVIHTNPTLVCQFGKRVFL